MHGKGKFVFSNGQVEDGMHENNKFVGAQWLPEKSIIKTENMSQSIIRTITNTSLIIFHESNVKCFYCY